MRRLSVTLSCLLAALASSAEERKPVFLNYDATHFDYSRSQAGMQVDETEMRRLVRQYADTQVSDMLFDVGGRTSNGPSAVKESCCDKFRQARENGRDVCYTNVPCVRLPYETWVLKKLDRFALWIDETRKIGIRPWLSFRLNDCHDNHLDTSWLHPAFYHDHPEYRRVRHRARQGYFDRCFDFACPAVRERELAYIAEMLDRYDPDGVETDWMREPFCFQPGREDAATITAFMRDVRALADRAAARRGHAVKVMARVPADPETALGYGFDAATWADEKLIDVLAPCPRWETTDNEIPVGLWKRLMRGTGVTVVPGVELRQWTPKCAYLTTTEQLMGAVSAFYSAGADGLYLFNYFDDPSWQGENPFWMQPDMPPGLAAVWWSSQLKWLKFVGSPERMLAEPRDHTVTYRDIVPLWERTAPPFPRKAGPDEVEFFRVVTGKVPPGRAVTLRLGVGGASRPQVWVNSRACRHLRDEASVPEVTDGPLAVYEVPGYAEAQAVVEVQVAEPTNVTYLDMRIRETK